MLRALIRWPIPMNGSHKLAKRKERKEGKLRPSSLFLPQRPSVDQHQNSPSEVPGLGCPLLSGRDLRSLPSATIRGCDLYPKSAFRISKSENGGRGGSREEKGQGQSEGTRRGREERKRHDLGWQRSSDGEVGEFFWATEREDWAATAEEESELKRWTGFWFSTNGERRWREGFEGVLFIRHPLV